MWYLKGSIGAHNSVLSFITGNLTAIGFYVFFLHYLVYISSVISWHLRWLKFVILLSDGVIQTSIPEEYKFMLVLRIGVYLVFQTLSSVLYSFIM